MKLTKHDLSHPRLLTSDMGYVVPIGIVETIPGDVFQEETSLFLRMSPMVAPIMHPVDVQIHKFFCPMRILWDGWEDFWTGGNDGNDTSTVPKIDTGAGGVSEGDLLDYLGVPTGTGSANLQVNALKVRAYQKTVAEYYIDKDIQTPVSVDSLDLQKACWAPDMFTMARPWEQRGDEVTIPFATAAEAPVVLDSTDTGYGRMVHDSTHSPDAVHKNIYQDASPAGAMTDSGQANNFVYDPMTSLVAELTGLDAISVSDLRFGLAMQKLRENRAFEGATYEEVLLAAYGVSPGDGRLQKPEYISGGRETLSITEVLQTAPESASGSIVGEMKGHGMGSLKSNRYRKRFKEHGYVLTLMVVRPRNMYLEGLHKSWFQTDKEDFHHKELEHYGAQAILNKEVQLSHTTPDGVFGWTDRGRAYREQPAHISGKFRSTLLPWHLARDLAADPALNPAFLECDPAKRIFGDTNDHALRIMAFHRINALRPISKAARPRIF